MEQPARPRVAAIDILRGFVMILMAIDHAAAQFDKHHLFTDSILFYKPGQELPAGEFFTRWITHLCAPTFVTLAGTALAISSASRKAKGQSEGEITKHIFVRGLIIFLLDVVWMSFAMRAPGKFLFQVLYAIGGSLMFMAFLRRLPDRALFALGVLLAVGDELLVGFFGGAHLLDTLPVALFVSPGFFFDGRLIIAYSLLPWLAMMCLGWVLGRRVVAGKDITKLVAITGAGLLAMFLVLRGVNSFGNMLLLREGNSLVQWLHVSKYPPSLTYDGLELGIGALLLAGLMQLTRSGVPRALEPLRTLGQTALFFYVLHIHLLKLVAIVFDIDEKLGMSASYIGGFGVVLALYPLCVWYRGFKQRHPQSLARFI